MIKHLFVAATVALITLGSCKKEEVVDYDTIDKAIIEEYLEENNITARSTSSGLHYYIENEGSGQRPANYSYVKIKYKGYLTNGRIFDEAKTPATFRLDQLIH